eukprot:3609763-Prymnesium_polylepis.1
MGSYGRSVHQEGFRALTSSPRHSGHVSHSGGRITWPTHGLLLHVRPPRVHHSPPASVWPYGERKNGLNRLCGWRELQKRLHQSTHNGRRFHYMCAPADTPVHSIPRMLARESAHRVCTERRHVGRSGRCLRLTLQHFNLCIDTPR